MVKTSRDDGATWSAGERLPDGILGPIKNRPVQLSSGVILSPSSTESPAADPVWRVHFERAGEDARNWAITEPVALGDGPAINAIQPSILIHPGGRLQAIGRTRSGWLFETWSTDEGRTWTPLGLLSVRNPNSGIDALTLRDGRHVLVYNDSPSARTPLRVALSTDGEAWTNVLTLEDAPGEYSYPAVIQAADGRLHISYTWLRQNIRHVVVDLGK